MKKNAKIKVINILSAVAVMILIGVMCYVSLQHAEPRRDICYTADFSDMHVELYPQYSVSDEACVYQDFLLTLNGKEFRKNWEWKAGEQESFAEAPSIYYADINHDQEQELIFVFFNGVDRGTSVRLESIYITDKNGKEYPVEDALQYVREHAQFDLNKEKEQVLIDIAMEDMQKQLEYANELFPDLETLDSAGCPDWVEYRIENNQLIAAVPVFVYATFPLPDAIHLQYEEIDSAFQITGFTCAPNL